MTLHLISKWASYLDFIKALVNDRKPSNKPVEKQTSKRCDYIKYSHLERRDTKESQQMLFIVRYRCATDEMSSKITLFGRFSAKDSATCSLLASLGLFLRASNMLPRHST